MENTIFAQAAKFLRERRDNRRWRITVCCLAVFVVCGTAWALARNGQAFVSSGAVLDCPVVVHEHTPDCFNEEGRQICGEADYVFHTHDDYCYDMDGQLVCELEEVEEHEHTVDCFETITTLYRGYGTIPAGESSIEETIITGEDRSAEGETLVCGMEEQTHSDDCYGQGESAEARKRQCGAGMLPSQSEFCAISMHFTATPRIPHTSHQLKTASINGSPGLSPGFLPLT